MSVALNDVRMPELANNEAVPAGLSTSNPYKFNLVWVNVHQADAFSAMKGERYFEGRYNIGFWAWETAEFPREWLSNFRLYHEIWTPSTFVRDILARLSPIPVLAMPHPVLSPPTPQDTDRSAVRAALGVPADAVVFLFVFHFHSGFERKNPLAIVDAFKHAFSVDDNAHLVIKSAEGWGTSDLPRLKDAARDANIHVVDRVMTRDELTALIEACDCYVSLHRSEGFGLTLAESMSLGKPVIATRYGGNTDFMTTDNSLLVDYELVTLSRNAGSFQKGWSWAEPDVKHAARHMRHVFEHPDAARKLGAQAQRDVQSNLSPERIGAQMRDRLRVLDDYWT